MNISGKSDTGYLASDMRNYLTNYYLPALNEAGVPNELMWNPTRIVWNGTRVGSLDETLEKVADKLWMPVEMEMFGQAIKSSRLYAEDEGNAYFEYYTNNTKRKKYNSSNTAYEYFLSSTSPPFDEDTDVYLTDIYRYAYTGVNTDGSACFLYAQYALNIAPAFVIN
jgi:hypothetical protein